MQCMISPNAGSRKLSKNNWKKVDIEVDYNTAREVFMSRKVKQGGGGPTTDRRIKGFNRGSAQRRNNFVDKNRESNGHNKESDRPHPPNQHFRSESMHHKQQRSAKIQNGEASSQRKEDISKEEKSNETKKDEKESQAPEQTDQQQNNQQQDPAYW